MKNLSLFVSSLALCASTSYAAINCNTLPTCSSLGYTDTVTHCPKSSTGAEMVVKCPFDTTRGKCIREAAVGQIAYFSKAPNSASGWLKCDGTSKSRTQYPELAAFLDTQFCNSQYHLNTTCPSTGGTFAVPNYQGYFLRAAGTPNSSLSKVGNGNLIIPQAEGLPNLWGGFPAFRQGAAMAGDNNLFTITGNWNSGLRSGGDSDEWMSWYSFNAHSCNSIYGNAYGGNTGVVPTNIAVYAYIYAGKVVQP